MDDFFDEEPFDEEPFDEEEPFGFEDDEDIDFDLGEEGVAAGNRRFLIILGVMGAVFVISACVLLLVLITRPTGPSDIDFTNTANFIVLATTQAWDTATAETAVARASTEEAAVTQTAEALVMTQTAEAEATAAALTQEAADAAATATARYYATQTQQAMETAGVTLTPTPTITLVPTITLTPEEGILPTKEPPPEPTAEEGELVPTGVADELKLGTSLFLVGLAAFGLLAVIFVSRRMRTGTPGS